MLLRLVLYSAVGSGEKDPRGTRIPDLHPLSMPPPRRLLFFGRREGLERGREEGRWKEGEQGREGWDGSSPAEEGGIGGVEGRAAHGAGGEHAPAAISNGGLEDVGGRRQVCIQMYKKVCIQLY